MPNEPATFAKIFEKKTFGAVVLLLILCIVATLVSILSHETIFFKTYPNAEAALLSVLMNFTAASIIYLLAYGFLREAKRAARASEVQEQVVTPISNEVARKADVILGALRDSNNTVSSELDQIKWEKLFEGANEIFLLVQGWDGWKARVAAHLPSFLANDGKIRVILHDPAEPELLKSWCVRMDKTEFQAKKEIEDTIRGLQELVKTHQKSANQFEYHYTKRMNWFCGIYFRSDGCKHGKLLLSIYQHKPLPHGFTVENVPSFLVRTDVFPELGEWFLSEWEHLKTPVTPIPSAEPK